MPAFLDTYKSSRIGYSGRVSFSSTAVSYFVPVLDAAKMTITNSVTGDTTNYDVNAQLRWPLLFQVVSTAACRLRQRVLHPTCPLLTADVFNQMTVSAGYTNVAAGTDLVRNATLVSASVPAGTTSLAARVFNTIDSGSYGAYVAAGVYFPLLVTSLRDVWLQITARDGTGSGTTGELHFTCVSDVQIVGY